MREKGPQQSRIPGKAQRKPEEPDTREIADDDLEHVTGGISSTGGGTSTSSVCVSQT